MFCRNCGKEVAPNVEVCINCGVKPANGTQFCSNCGTQTQAIQEICVKCGVKLKNASTTSGDNQALWCVLSYLSILSLIPLLTQKENKFIQFHARQGFALFLLAVGIFVAMIILGFIPFIGWIIGLASTLVNVGILVLSIVGIVKALQGEEWRIPVVADLAEKINL